MRLENSVPILCRLRLSQQIERTSLAAFFRLLADEYRRRNFLARPDLQVCTSGTPEPRNPYPVRTF